MTIATVITGGLGGTGFSTTIPEFLLFGYTSGDAPPPAALGWESATQAALYNRLSTFPGLLALVSTVADDIPQAGTNFPYVSIGEASHSEWDRDVELGNDVSVVIHSWSRYRGRTEIKEIQNQVYLALNRANLSIDGYNFVSCDFEGSESFVDSDGKTRHGVQTFRILLDNT